MIRLFVGTLGARACGRAAFYPLTTRSITSAAASSSSSTNAHAGLIVRDGKAVLYRGPSAMKTYLYYLIGGMFLFIGVEAGSNFYNHATWPLTRRDPENPPKLVALGYRIALAGVAGTCGLFFAWAFMAVPTKTITKLTLDIQARQLIIRTSSREFSALLPRILFPRPFIKTAEIRGYYKTDCINERIVPLSSVYRIRGSALSEAEKIKARSNYQKDPSKRDIRECLEIKVGTERAWYRLETSGGADPPRKGGYKGFWRRISHRMRGVTDWEEQRPASIHSDQLGDKEPWFANRKTFDDVIPLIKRM